jgi:hypothetical protein
MGEEIPDRYNELTGETPIVMSVHIVYQLLAHGRWFSTGIPASSTTNADRHDIAEIMLKVALNTKNEKSNQKSFPCSLVVRIWLKMTTNTNNIHFWC